MSFDSYVCYANVYAYLALCYALHVIISTYSLYSCICLGVGDINILKILYPNIIIIEKKYCDITICDWAKTRHVHIQTEIHFTAPAYSTK